MRKIVEAKLVTKEMCHSEIFKNFSFLILKERRQGLDGGSKLFRLLVLTKFLKICLVNIVTELNCNSKIFRKFCRVVQLKEAIYGNY